MVVLVEVGFAGEDEDGPADGALAGAIAVERIHIADGLGDHIGRLAGLGGEDGSGAPKQEGKGERRGESGREDAGQSFHNRSV